MSRLLRAGLAVVAACAFLAGPAALAENKPSGTAQPSRKVAPQPKGGSWYVPEMDSDQSSMANSKGGAKTPAARGSVKP